jgi:class 3 adenylate cyclase
MPEERAQRRIAAILAADVVGYSRMMQADEAGTLTSLKARRTGILQPLISTHRGRIVKVMGDGVLVEFASAVNGVASAVVSSCISFVRERSHADSKPVRYLEQFLVLPEITRGGDTS